MAIFSDSDLIELAHRYAGPDFIAADPISIPHQFAKKEDIEIAGFCTAIISWGNRSSILRSAQTLMSLMWDSPYEFVMQADKAELNNLNGFVHRTFNGTDAKWLVMRLRQMYMNGGLEAGFSNALNGETDFGLGLHQFRKQFLQNHDPGRSGKHIADPVRGSAAKRINMFLRWMVRSNKEGVDFGLWDFIPAKRLHLPLDIHSGTVARELGLLTRKQNDWKSVVALTERAKQILPNDPAFLDYALFGMGVETTRKKGPLSC
jgi:uncharacterized protein (TIGR02757 family)